MRDFIWRQANSVDLFSGERDSVAHGSPLGNHPHQGFSEGNNKLSFETAIDSQIDRYFDAFPVQIADEKGTESEIQQALFETLHKFIKALVTMSPMPLWSFASRHHVNLALSSLQSFNVLHDLRESMGDVLWNVEGLILACLEAWSAHPG